MRLLLAVSSLCFILISCSLFRKDNDPTGPIYNSKLKTLEEKRNLYIGKAREAQDSHTFIHSPGDALLFTCLASIGGGLVTDFAAAEIEPGRWGRHPLEPGPSHPPGTPLRSATKFSNDMGLGLLHCIWNHSKDDYVEAGEMLARHIDYGETHNWDMCGPDGASGEGERLARCLYKPTLIATAYDLGVYLGLDCGTRCRIAQAVPYVWNPKATGFEAHLVVIHMLLRGALDAGLNDLQVAFLKSVAEREEKNALFHAVHHFFTDGNQAKALDILLDESLFPADRLPTSDQYCTDYLWQRDRLKDGALTSDWKPCPEREETHYGDFTFAATIVLGMFPRMYRLED